MAEGSNEPSQGCTIFQSRGNIEETVVQVTQKEIETNLHYVE